MVPLTGLLGEPVDLDIVVPKEEVVRVDDVELRNGVVREIVEVVNEYTDVLVGGGPVMVTYEVAVEVTVVETVVVVELEEASCAKAKRGVSARRRKEMRVLKSILIDWLVLIKD